MVEEMVARIETHATLEGFFGDLIQEALAAERLDLDESSVSYLLSLCREFSRHEVMFGSERPGESGTPGLVWLFERAQSTDRGTRFQAYRHLGDVSLMVSGFFSPHIERERSLVGVEYYVQMGSNAYDSAAALAQANNFGQLLSELAQKFRRVVEVLMRVAEQTTLPIARDVAALYERYSRNPESLELLRRLSQQGAAPCFAAQAVKC